MERIREKLEEIAKLPYCQYRETTELAVGSIGLWMNAAYGRLCQMQVELAYAMKCAGADSMKDVEETFTLFAQNLQKIRKHLAVKAQILAGCPDEDQRVRDVVLAFMDAFGEKLLELEDASRLRADKGSAEAQMKDYQGMLEALRNICGEYISLHIGDLSPWDILGKR